MCEVPFWQLFRKTPGAEGKLALVQEPLLMQAELNHLTAELQKLTAHKEKLLQDLPALCALSASLQDTHVLHEDYTAKLMRQQHCIAKKQAFLRLLIEQHARNELLCMARDAEVGQLQSQMQELQLLLDVLTGVKAASQQRIACYTSKELQHDLEAKLVVHNSDSFLQTLDRLLSSGGAECADDCTDSCNDAKLYVTVEQLKQRLGELGNRTFTSARQQHAEGMHKQIAASLKASFGSLHSLVFPDCNSSAVQLTSPEMCKALQQAQSASADLTQAVQQVTEQQHTYHDLLSQQRMQLEAERQVFSRFHLNPESLQDLCLS